MTFRRGGRTARKDSIFYGNEELIRTKSFKYLGITFQTTATSFVQSIKDRAIAAILAIHVTNNIHLLSMETAMALFKMKIRPIMTCGLNIIWEFLKNSGLMIVGQRVKVTFLKRLTQASKFTPTRLIYELCRKTFFIEELRIEILLPSTAAVEQHLCERTMKRNDIWEDF
jgi:hypothetical protein